MNINGTCLDGCTPHQIISLTYPIKDMSSLVVYNDCNEAYDISKLEYSYSLDGACWTCYMSYDDIVKATLDINSDFYINIKVAGIIGGVSLDNTPITDYTTQLQSGFVFGELSGNTYNPYSGLDTAIALQQQLAETVSNIVGIPIYYFKLSPNAGSKDLTFKEYALMNVESVKQIKLIIAEGTMPSSRPEFEDWGISFQTDWETEISKGTFATAFGNTAQPMEGDLIYIPLQKRMWMVTGAYEEKNEGLMWQATTFKVLLTKYQEKGSVDLGSAEDMVNSFVKNKYEDLFGEDDQSTYDSGEVSTDAPNYAAGTLYSVFESDATRKYVTCDSIDIPQDIKLYYRGAMISDSRYVFTDQIQASKIVYQKQYCGDCASISFIITPQMAFYESKNVILSIGNLKVIIEQNGNAHKLYLNVKKNLYVNLNTDVTYFIILRWSKAMNIYELHAYQYTWNQDIPQYKLQKSHYYFDMNNPVDKKIDKYDIELQVTSKTDIFISNFYGWITNIKIFDIYNDNNSELLQMYPTHQHLMINDTVRKIVDLPGVRL